MEEILNNLTTPLKSAMLTFITTKVTSYFKIKSFEGAVAKRTRGLVNSKADSDFFIEDLIIVFSDEKITDIARNIIKENGFISLDFIKKQISSVFNKYNINEHEFGKCYNDLITVIIKLTEEIYHDIAANLYSKNTYNETRNQTNSLNKIEKNTTEILKRINDYNFENENIKQVSYKRINVSNKFVGREEIISKIVYDLNFTNNIIMLTGMGGIGKSEICKSVFLHYLNQNTSNCIKNIAFVEYADDLKSSIFKKLEIEEVIDEKEEDYFERIKFKYLNQSSFVLFLDGVDNVSKKFIDEVNSFSCKIIFTSRVLIDCFTTYNIQALSFDDCIELYRKHSSNDIEEKDVREIISIVNYHTLAIELLAKTQKASRKTSNEFLSLLKVNGFNLKLDDTVCSYGINETTIIEHLSKIFDLFILNESEIVILYLFALLQENYFINGKILSALFEIPNFNVLNKLVKYGWLQEDEIEGFSMHAVISEVIRYRNIKIDINIIIKFVENLAKEVYIDSYSSYYMKLPIQHHCISVLNKLCNEEVGNTIEYSNLELNVGTLYAHSGWYNKALLYFNKCMLLRKKILEYDDLLLGEIYNSKASVLDLLGLYDESIELFKNAIKIQKTILDEDDLTLAISYNNIAGAYNHKGMYDKALNFYELAISIRLKKLESNHPDISASYNDIGLAHYEIGDNKKALYYFQASLDISLKVFDINHPNLASLYNNIALTYIEENEIEKALEFYLKTLDINSLHSDENHPDMAATYNNIANVYSKKGEIEKSLEFFNKSINIRLEKLGENHLSLASTYNNLAGVYDDINEQQKSLEFYKKAISIYINTNNLNHPILFKTYCNLASLYVKNADFKNSIVYYKKALEIISNVTSYKNIDTVFIYKNIINISCELRNYKQAREFQLKLILLYEEGGYNSLEVKKEKQFSRYLLDMHLKNIKVRK